MKEKIIIAFIVAVCVLSFGGAIIYAKSQNNSSKKTVLNNISQEDNKKNIDNKIIEKHNFCKNWLLQGQKNCEYPYPEIFTHAEIYANYEIGYPTGVEPIIDDYALKFYHNGNNNNDSIVKEYVDYLNENNEIYVKLDNISKSKKIRIFRNFDGSNLYIDNNLLDNNTELVLMWRIMPIKYEFFFNVMMLEIIIYDSNTENIVGFIRKAVKKKNETFDLTPVIKKILAN